MLTNDKATSNQPAVIHLLKKKYFFHLIHLNISAVTFIVWLMHSIIQNLEVKIYVVEKFKRHKIKNSVSFKLLYNVYFNLYVLYNWVH